MPGHAPVLVLLLAAIGCNAAPAPPAPREPPEGYVACSDPRPEVCTKQYDPVCAQRDTGVRCVTTPCPSAEPVSYGNACEACADPKVLGHRPGACEDAEAG